MKTVEKIKAAAAEPNRFNSHRGSNFDDFLKEEGLLADCKTGALRRVAALRLKQKTERRKIAR